MFTGSREDRDDIFWAFLAKKDKAESLVATVNAKLI
jgi:hypothetical protein